MSKLLGLLALSKRIVWYVEAANPFCLPPRIIIPVRGGFFCCEGWLAVWKAR